MKTHQIKAFTLVELIIVITILAILATIGFMSYQSYTLDARDGKRKADLWELRTWLEVYQAKNAKLIDPDNFATIYTWALVFSYQWYAWTNVLAKLRAGDSFIDTTDKKYYTYSIDPNKTKYQLLAMLENNPNNTVYNDLVKQTYALDYTNRYSYTLWDNFWIILSGSTNIPVQEGNSGSNVTITDNPTNYNIVVDNENIWNSSSTNWEWDSTLWFKLKWGDNNYYYPKSCNDLIISVSTDFKIWTTWAYNWTKFIDWVYYIKPNSNPEFKVYCDMTTDNGGWSLVANSWNTCYDSSMDNKFKQLGKFIFTGSTNTITFNKSRLLCNRSNASFDNVLNFSSYRTNIDSISWYSSFYNISWSSASHNTTYYANFTEWHRWNWMDKRFIIRTVTWDSYVHCYEDYSIVWNNCTLWQYWQIYIK